MSSSLIRLSSRNHGRGLFEFAARNGVVEEVLLAEFGSDEARRESVSCAVRTFSTRGQPKLARKLAARFSLDVEERTAIEALIESAGERTRSASTTSSANNVAASKPHADPLAKGVGFSSGEENSS